MATSEARAGDWVSRASDGQLGQLIERDGALMVRLDRGKGTHEIVEPYISKRWTPSPRRLPLAAGAVARVAHGAVVELRRLRGEYGTKEWSALSDAEQKTFATIPPLEPEQRALWEAIFSALNPNRSR